MPNEPSSTEAAGWLTPQVASSILDEVRKRKGAGTSEHDFEFWFLHSVIARHPEMGRYLFIENYDTDKKQLPDVVIGNRFDQPDLCIEFSEKEPLQHQARLKEYCNLYKCQGYHVYFKDSYDDSAPIRISNDPPITNLEIPVTLQKKEKPLNDERIKRIFEIPYSKSLISCVIVNSTYSEFDETFRSNKDLVRQQWARDPHGKFDLQGQLASINRIANIVDSNSRSEFRIRLQDARLFQQLLEPAAKTVILRHPLSARR